MVMELYRLLENKYGNEGGEYEITPVRNEVIFVGKRGGSVITNIPEIEILMGQYFPNISNVEELSDDDTCKRVASRSIFIDFPHDERRDGYNGYYFVVHEIPANIEFNFRRGNTRLNNEKRRNVLSFTEKMFNYQKIVKTGDL